MWNAPLGKVRTIALFEAVSFLLLLGVAMPLKYLAGMPLAVRVVGMAHGVLFIALGFLLAQALGDGRLSFKQAATIFVASLLPFVPFFVDARIKGWVAAPAQSR